MNEEFINALDQVRELASPLDRQIFERDYTEEPSSLGDLALSCKHLFHAAQQVRRTLDPLGRKAFEFQVEPECKKYLKKCSRIPKSLGNPAWMPCTPISDFTRQIEWLLHRSPEHKFQAVPGLCRAVRRGDIEGFDWSLTRGRYVGVAPTEEDENFNFEQALRDIHVDPPHRLRVAAHTAIYERGKGICRKAHLRTSGSKARTATLGLRVIRMHANALVPNARFSKTAMTQLARQLLPIYCSATE